MISRRRLAWFGLGIASSALGFGAVGSALSDVIRVPADQPTIQAGIDAASEGDTVLVAQGTYKGDGNHDIDFGGVDRVLRSQSGAAVTVIDCEGTEEHLARGLYFHTHETPRSVVEGFTFTGGWSSAAGGGIFCGSGSSPHIIDCVIAGNQTLDHGGGVYCTSEESSPSLTNCTIAWNRADYGGGVGCEDSAHPHLTSCTITRNVADSGGGLHCRLASPALTACTISENRAEVAGGGLGAYYYSSPTLTNCTVSLNSAAAPGGGLECSGASSPRLWNCTIKGNTAGSNGGGLFCGASCLPYLENCLISKNRTGLSGGGIAFYNTAPLLQNCTLAGNIASMDGGAIHCSEGSAPRLINCILWSDQPNEIYVASGSPELTYCDVEGGYEGEGNIDAPPLFRSVRGFDYLLGPNSPCIDTGHPIKKDRVSDWYPRWPDWYPNGPRSDMGMYGGSGNWRWLFDEPPGVDDLGSLARREQ